MKLELKHLAPYLPYKLKAVDYFDGMKLEREIVPSNIMAFVEDDTRAKPILRPLSDLNKEIGCVIQNDPSILRNYLIEIDGMSGNLKYIGKHNQADCFKYFNQCVGVLALPFHIIEKLTEYHFDIFGLIENGLAIDINTLKND